MPHTLDGHGTAKDNESLVENQLAPSEDDLSKNQVAIPAVHNQDATATTPSISTTIPSGIATCQETRKDSVTSLGIRSSLTASLAGALNASTSPPLLPTSHSDTMIRFIDTSNMPSITNLSDREGILDGSAHVRRKRLSFLHLHLPEPTGWGNSHHHHNTFGSHLSHIHVPTLTFTAPASDGTGRKFSFGIRRHSHTVSPRVVIPKAR